MDNEKMLELCNDGLKSLANSSSLDIHQRLDTLTLVLESWFRAIVKEIESET